RLADSVKHKPRTLLSHTKRARQLTRANSVLRVGNQPDRRKPSVKADRTIFHDRAHLDAELLFASFAFPQAARRQVRHFAGKANRTLNAVRPAKLRKKVRA